MCLAPGRDFYLLTSPSSVLITHREQTPSKLRAISIVAISQNFSLPRNVMIYLKQCGDRRVNIYGEIVRGEGVM